MNFVQHIIQINNRINRKCYLSETEEGKIVVNSIDTGKRIFDTNDEFLTWFKNSSVKNIKNKVTYQ